MVWDNVEAHSSLYWSISNSIRTWEYCLQINLPANLVLVHLLFHVVMLKKCISDTSLMVPKNDIGVKGYPNSKGVPIKIHDRQV